LRKTLTKKSLKSKGISVQIFERAASCSNMGAGIVLWPDTIFVLKQMGLSRKRQNSLPSA
jgi:2-polyprenyl-6-methoxyphenol hydroxylase-like FAD-dependent oxidoreductase